MSAKETAHVSSSVEDTSKKHGERISSENTTGYSDSSKAAEPRQTAAQISGERNAGSVCTASNASHTSINTSALSGENKSSLEPYEPLKTETQPAQSDVPSCVLSKPAIAAVAAASSTMSSLTAPPKAVNPAAVRTPGLVGAGVAPAAIVSSGGGVQGLGATTTHPGGATMTPNQTGGPTLTPAPLQGTIITLPRTSTPQQTVAVARSPQTTSIQLPANFQIPQGMVLIRSDSGQLMLVSQQALAQAQAQGLVPKPPGVTASTRPQASQATATGTPIIRVSLPSSSATVATIIKPASATGTAVLMPTSTTGTTIIKPSTMTGNTVIKPPSALGNTGLKPSSTTGTTVIKTTTTQKPVSSQRTISGSVSSTSVVKSVGKAPLSSSVNLNIRTSGPRNISPNIPSKSNTTKSSTPIAVTTETLENVKKCKNFLVTLMKLASSGTRSANMAQNVRALVKDLLDGQLEAEEFTEKLYMELRSSPQPYLVPFLKRSLPAVRQLTPNSQLFIQQCDQPKSSSSSSSTSSSTSQKPSITTTTTSTTISQPFRSSLQAKVPQMVTQQPKAVTVKQPVTSLTRIDLPVQNFTQPKQLLIQTNTQPARASGRQFSLQALKAPSSGPPPATHAHSFKDSTPGSFRDDDDINDVASMAGVNVNEENARILASSSELVGSVVHSCRDEPFLHTSALQQRALRIGSSLGVTELSSDVLGLLSHATQERLRGLLEKLSAIAQHRSVSYRDDWRYIQTNDTRSQLKFLEQLEKMEKRRREEEEREALLRIARTRSSSEDPEQLRLKQRAKEMQQLELAQMQHREANLAALAALGPRKRKPLEVCGPGANQVLVGSQRSVQRIPTRVTFRDLIFCMEQDPTLRLSHMLYNAYLR